MEVVMPEKVEWRDIPGYEGYYQVSNNGDVRSVDRKIINSLGHELSLKGKILKPKKDYEYFRVELNAHGKSKLFFIHRLVLLAFVGEIPEGMQCRHLDGDAKNNSLSNLAYGTVSENQLDRVRHGTHQESIKTHCPRGHVLKSPNLTAAGMRKGKRICLACARAHGYTSHRKDLRPRLKEVSDSYYEKIMKAAQQSQDTRCAPRIKEYG